MASVSTHLNFSRNTEEAFNFYKSVFGTEFVGGLIHRFGEIPPQPDAPPMSEADKNLVMHVALPTIGGHFLMGSDAPESMGRTVKPGNNFYICLAPDTRAETDRFFKALSAGGKAEMPLAEMFWGDYFGTLTDRFGIQWMFNCTSKT